MDARNVAQVSAITDASSFILPLRYGGKLVVGNWKMHGSLAALAELDGIVETARHWRVDVAICLPATLIVPGAQRIPDLLIGAQDCHERVCGSHTGDISATMIADAGARMSIVGHSERRGGHGETDAIVRAKLEAVVDQGLDAILCVGEPEAERRAGNPATFVRRQLTLALQGLRASSRLMIAYEPIWAIGSGQSASSDQIEAMHAGIRQTIRDCCSDGAADVRILYGGSVTSSNADAILGLDAVDGVLVGGASLTADRLAPIIAAAARQRPDETTNISAR